MRRAIRTGLLATLVSLGIAAPAAADEAVPSRYETTIESITPAVDTVTVSMIGGDNFVELSVTAGHEVIVLGYEAEPYLWFQADGTVSENRRSKATYLDDTRYGTVEVPDDLLPSDEPEWVEIADGGRWAWRDHRAHWLSDTPPLGLAPGDQVLDNTIPLDVDGQRVTVRLLSTWVPEPSRLPVDVAAVVGVILGFSAMSRRGVPGVPVLVVGVLATVVGVWQVLSLPSETAPGPLVWVLPVVTVIGGAAATAYRNRGWSNWVAVGGALAVTVWAGLRAEVIRYAVLPTDAPFWFDRAVTAGAAVTGVITIVATMIGALRRRRDAGDAGERTTPTTTEPSKKTVPPNKAVPQKNAASSKKGAQSAKKQTSATSARRGR